MLRRGCLLDPSDCPHRKFARPEACDIMRMLPVRHSLCKVVEVYGGRCEVFETLEDDASSAVDLLILKAKTLSRELKLPLAGRGKRLRE